MNPAEAAVLLSKIAANDNREVTEVAARAWAEALPDVDVADAIEWLPRYYRAATRDGKNWVYPGDVLLGVRELFTERRRALMEEAERLAIEAVADPESDEVMDQGGAQMIGFRARIPVMKQFDLDHPMPGEEIDRKSRESAPRNPGWQFGMGA